MEKKEKEKKKGGKLLSIFLLLVVIVVTIFLYAKYTGIKGLIVKEYRVKSEILTNNFSGLKIIHFSDLLYKSTVDKEDVKNLIKRINELKPDIVVFTGDLINKNAKINNEDIEFLEEELESILAKVGKYAIYGDEDYSIESYKTIMEKSKFKILNNSYDEIFYKNNESMFIIGLPSSLKEEIKLEDAFNFYKEDEKRKFIIVLVHDGKTIRFLDESTYEVDLVLGGHSLNGSIVIPYYGGIFIDDGAYKYYQEHYSKGITDIYISSGIGTNKYPYRIFNKPSFNLYRLKAQS
ncbi:MAG: metallophosphoesterase [Mollicutes bacterium]|nr:metallophosphoesterase [Mollicutes bacterium]